MKRSNDQPVAVKCTKCGLTVQVPVGGRRLCGCGNWLSGDKPAEVGELDLEPAAAEAGGTYPRIESDLAAIERLNDGYRRITRELSKAIVGQQRVLEEL